MQSYRTAQARLAAAIRELDDARENALLAERDFARQLAERRGINIGDRVTDGSRQYEIARFSVRHDTHGKRWIVTPYVYRVATNGVRYKLGARFLWGEWEMIDASRDWRSLIISEKEVTSWFPPKTE